MFHVLVLKYPEPHGGRWDGAVARDELGQMVCGFAALSASLQVVQVTATREVGGSSIALLSR
jgi:hypothetical protein